MTSVGESGRPAAGPAGPAPGRAGAGGGGIGVAVGLAMGPAVALGLARFAYALLLPAMRADLHWSFAAAGAVNTANAVGYLAGALLAGPLTRRASARSLFVAGLAVTAGALFVSGVTGDLGVLLAVRAVAGASGAVSFVVGGGLAAQAGAGRSHARAALLLGIYVAGGGAGIVASGLAVPALLAHTAPATGWRWGWLLLAALAALALIASLPALRATRPPAPAPAAASQWPARSLAPTLVAYGLFGAGYIAYMTFIVAFLRAEGTTSGQVGLFWVVLGTSAVVAAFAWGPVLGRLRGGHGPAVCLAVVTVGAVLPLLARSTTAAFVSAVLFGGSFLTVVTAVTALARASLPAHHWTPAIAGLTAAFALGQCAGPLLAGALSDTGSGTAAGMLLSAGILAVGTVIALLQAQREPSQ